MRPSGNTRAALSNVKSALLKRRGQFIPGADKIKKVLDPGWASFLHKGITGRDVDPADSAARTRVKSFMRSHFFTQAPIPVALRLDEPDNAEVQAFLDREMDMYLNSGASIEICGPDGALAGVGMAALWPRNDDYEAIDAPALHWHNAAAEIAAEAAGKEDPRLVWRDYQFQHLYDLSQRLMRLHDRRVTLWAGCLSYDRSIRDVGVSVPMLSTINGAMAAERGIIGTQSNFRGFDKTVTATFPNALLAEEVKYADEDLTVDGVKVFDRILHCDGSRFYIGLP